MDYGPDPIDLDFKYKSNKQNSSKRSSVRDSKIKEIEEIFGNKMTKMFDTFGPDASVNPRSKENRDSSLQNL